MSGTVEPDPWQLSEAAGDTGERVAAGDPHCILGLVQSVIANPYITRQGVRKKEHALIPISGPPGEGGTCIFSHTRSHFHGSCLNINLS